ncbi:hypothetical protein Ddye_015251 [Dipteronia dyeriana]|uniref:Uncharacterized protein n=1 Tax=Dipteronia dyeriana TaxID=168575 RepID=A0AAD9WZ63_9ROSI|nr:hypothetical protein Ddye_015251 [Dipteronia dyeriana]
MLMSQALLKETPNSQSVEKYLLDESNFESAISSFDLILVDIYAPCWMKQAPVLVGLKKPIVVAKVNADKGFSVIKYWIGIVTKEISLIIRVQWVLNCSVCSKLVQHYMSSIQFSK